MLQVIHPYLNSYPEDPTYPYELDIELIADCHNEILSELCLDLRIYDMITISIFTRQVADRKCLYSLRMDLATSNIPDKEIDLCNWVKDFLFYNSIHSRRMPDDTTIL